MLVMLLFEPLPGWTGHNMRMQSQIHTMWFVKRVQALLL
jgi:hypothetical protein